MEPPVGTVRLRPSGTGYTVAIPSWEWIWSGGQWFKRSPVSFNKDIDTLLLPEEWV